MKKVYSILEAYRRIARWNGESAADLYEYMKTVVLTLPIILVQPLPFILQKIGVNRSLRFDLTNVAEPILAVDRNGYAVVGTLRRFRLLQLRTIDTRDRTYEIAPPTVSVRCRPSGLR